MSRAPVSFYFDLASPLAYLASERALQVLPGPAPWLPVLARELPGAGRFAAVRGREAEEIFRAEVARRARDLGLQPLRWPEPFPFDSELAMRAATYACEIGRGVAFAQAAFRQAFAGGHALQDPDHVLIAAAACEMHPSAVQQALARSSIAARLARATSEAAAVGVREVPAVMAGGRVFEGERALEEARDYVGGRGAPLEAAAR